MTRFDATDSTERRALYAEAIEAHRARTSPFCTFEVDAGAIDAGTEVPWIQFGDGTLNADCSDTELENLTDLLSRFPALRIDELTRPENADGTNVRISALVDETRIAEFVDLTFQKVYGCSEDYRGWVTAV